LFFFSFVWQLISPFIHEVTKRKVQVLTKDFSSILEVIDEDVLEQDFGGKSTFKYKFEEIWKREDELYPPEMDDDEPPKQEESKETQGVKEESQE
jgi:hypothetical protein